MVAARSWWDRGYWDCEDPARAYAKGKLDFTLEAVAHCAEYHSSRDAFGAIKPKTRFAGAKDPEGVGYIPNITPARIEDWKPEEIAEMPRSGVTPNHGRVGSSMMDVVTNTAMRPQSDRDAIAVYINSLPSRDTPQP